MLFWYTSTLGAEIKSNYNQQGPIILRTTLLSRGSLRSDIREAGNSQSKASSANSRRQPSKHSAIKHERRKESSKCEFRTLQFHRCRRPRVQAVNRRKFIKLASSPDQSFQVIGAAVLSPNCQVTCVWEVAFSLGTRPKFVPPV